MFLATDLEPDRAPPPQDHGVEERFLEVVEVSLSEVDDLIASGRLTDAQTMLGLLLARDALGDAQGAARR
jgi:hypothetical protein